MWWEQKEDSFLPRVPCGTVRVCPVPSLSCCAKKPYFWQLLFYTSGIASFQGYDVYPNYWVFRNTVWQILLIFCANTSCVVLSYWRGRSSSLIQNVLQVPPSSGPCISVNFHSASTMYLKSLSGTNSCTLHLEIWGSWAFMEVLKALVGLHWHPRHFPRCPSYSAEFLLPCCVLRWFLKWAVSAQCCETLCRWL